MDILLYLLPNIYNQFLFQKQGTSTIYETAHVTILEQFLELEVYYFIINVNTMVIFLLLTYLSKFKSIVHFKGAIISDCGNYLRMDVWNNPKTSDFFHNLKFEYFNIKMNLTDMLMAVYLCFRIFHAKQERHSEYQQFSTFLTPVIGFALVNLVQYPILIMAITRSYEDSGCKKCLIIAFGIVIAFIYLDMGMMFLMELGTWSQGSAPNSDPDHPIMIFVFWYEIQLVSVPIWLSYLFLQRNLIPNKVYFKGDIIKIEKALKFIEMN